MIGFLISSLNWIFHETVQKNLELLPILLPSKNVSEHMVLNDDDNNKNNQNSKRTKCNSFNDRNNNKDKKNKQNNSKKIDNDTKIC